MNINRDEIFVVDDYRFFNFISLNEEQKLMVLTWRNSSSVRCWMTNNDIISWDAHLRFIDSLAYRNDTYYWLVYKRDQALGVVDIYNLKGGTAEGGYYLSPEFAKYGNGFEFHYYYKYFLFNIIGISVLKGPLLLSNKNSYMFVTFFGGKLGEFLEIKGRRYVMIETSGHDFNQLKININDLSTFIKHMKESRIKYKELFK